MPIKDILKKKVPVTLHSSDDFKLIVQLAQKNNLKTSPSVKKYITEKLAKLKANIKKGSVSSTGNWTLRRYKQKAKALEAAKKIADRYL